jgi:hypothetical protein
MLLVMLRLCKILALLSAFGIVLPPPWCCGMMGCAPTPVTRLNANCCKRGCCQQTCCPRAGRQLNQRSGSGKIPNCPNYQFCIQRAAVLPAKRFQADAPILALPLAICHVAIVLDPVDASRAWTPPDPDGPPTHLLHCVWRC